MQLEPCPALDQHARLARRSRVEIRRARGETQLVRGQLEVEQLREKVDAQRAVLHAPLEELREPHRHRVEREVGETDALPERIQLAVEPSTEREAGVRQQRMDR